MIFDRFVGIPYLDKGRSIVGCDCYGLMWMVYRELRGIDLPRHDELYVTGADREATARLIAGQLDSWLEIEAGQEATFDGILMREGKFTRHIGIVAGRGKALHVISGESSRIERYGSGRLAHRIVGFYRYRDHE